MGAPDILHWLRQAGFKLQANGDRLLVQPASSLTDEHRQAIRDHRQQLLAALTEPINQNSGNPHLTIEQMDDCHAGGWSESELATFCERRDRLIRWGRAEQDAEHLAERLTLRDREGDDRRLCLECTYLTRTGRCLQAARGLMEGAGRVLEPITTQLVRCERFTGSKA